VQKERGGIKPSATRGRTDPPQPLTGSGHWTHMTQSSVRVRINATAHTPDKEGEGLIDGAHVAIDEGHEPRLRGIVGIRRRRPIVGGGLDVGKGIASRQGGIRGCHGWIHQACQLSERRQAPAFAAADRLLRAVIQRN